MRAPNRSLSSFVRDTAGISAVEFALIAPLMITLYLGACELCNLLLADRKVTNVTAATTDLVAQEMSISNNEMTDIFTASSAIMEPYDLSTLKIVVSSVVMDAGGNTTVAWSDGYQTNARAVGSAFTLPTGLVSSGGSVIVTEVSYVYSSPVQEIWPGGFAVHDTFYQKPRRTAQIPRVS